MKNRSLKPPLTQPQLESYELDAALSSTQGPNLHAAGDLMPMRREDEATDIKRTSHRRGREQKLRARPLLVLTRSEAPKHPKSTHTIT